MEAITLVKPDMDVLALRRELYMGAAKLALEQRPDATLVDVTTFAKACIEAIWPDATIIHFPQPKNLQPKIVPPPQPEPETLKPIKSIGEVAANVTERVRQQRVQPAAPPPEPPAAVQPPAPAELTEAKTDEGTAEESSTCDPATGKITVAPKPVVPGADITAAADAAAKAEAGGSNLELDYGWDHDKERRLYELKEVQGLAFDLVAKQMNKTEGACRSRVALMKEKRRWVRDVTDRVLAAHETQAAYLGNATLPG